MKIVVRNFMKRKLVIFESNKVTRSVVGVVSVEGGFLKVTDIEKIERLDWQIRKEWMENQKKSWSWKFFHAMGAKWEIDWVLVVPPAGKAYAEMLLIPEYQIISIGADC